MYALGATIAILSAFFRSNASLGLTLLILGRVIYGVGIGFSMHGAPSYISEMAPAELRGTLIAAKEGIIVFGVLFGNTSGYLLRNTTGGWVFVFLLQVLFSCIMFAGNYILPPSARWLAITPGTDAEVFKSVAFVFHESVSQNIANEILDQARTSRDANAGNAKQLGFFASVTNLVCSPRYRKQLVAGLGVVALQQITGQPSALYCTDPIFQDAGLDSWANTATGGFKLVATLLSVVLVDRLGRKQLLYIGNSLMALSLVAVAVAFGMGELSEGDGFTPQSIVILTCLLLFIGGYQVGFGPVAWTLISEIFPLEVRGQAVALAVQVNFFLNLVISFLFLIEIEVFGASLTFAIFAGLLFYSLYFVWRHVPETKGMTLEEIERAFNCCSNVNVNNDVDGSFVAGKCRHGKSNVAVGEAPITVENVLHACVADVPGA